MWQFKETQNICEEKQQRLDSYMYPSIPILYNPRATIRQPATSKVVFFFRGTCSYRSDSRLDQSVEVSISVTLLGLRSDQQTQQMFG